MGTAVTFVCAFYPVSKAAKNRGVGAEVFFAIAFFLCSFLPFEKIVKIFYPVAGVLGGGVIAYCVVFSLRKKDSAFEKKEKIEEEDSLRKGRISAESAHAHFRGLFHGDAFRKVSRFIGVEPLAHGKIVGDQLPGKNIFGKL